MTQSSGLSVRRYGFSSRFVGDYETASLLPGGAGVDFTAFTDVTKYGVSGSRAIRAGTIVAIRNGLAVPFAVAPANPTAATFAVNTAYTAGQYVQPSPANGYVYMVTTAGTSAATAPTWPTTLGGSVTSGTATFTEAALPGSVLTFAASHDYHTGQYVTPTVPNGHSYRVIDGGTTDATEPTWPTIEGQTVTNGGVTFADVPNPSVPDDVGRAYLMASDSIEPAGSFFLTSGQGTTGLYAGGVFYEDLLPDADPLTHKLPAALRSALGPLFVLTESFSFHEQNTP